MRASWSSHTGVETTCAIYLNEGKEKEKRATSEVFRPSVQAPLAKAAFYPGSLKNVEEEKSKKKKLLPTEVLSLSP